MIQKLGYQSYTRANGSKWYLCDNCISIGYVTGDEEKMKDHCKKVHNIPLTELENSKK